jgi:hypothetical protein
MARSRDEHDEYEEEEPRRRPPRRRDEDEDEYEDRPRGRSRQLGFMDRTFANTNIVILVLFGFCCGIIALAFSIAGLVVCTDPVAKRNAMIVTIISGIMTVAGVVLQLSGALAGAR